MKSELLNSVVSNSSGQVQRTPDLVPRIIHLLSSLPSPRMASFARDRGCSQEVMKFMPAQTFRKTIHDIPKILQVQFLAAGMLQPAVSGGCCRPGRWPPIRPCRLERGAGAASNYCLPWQGSFWAFLPSIKFRVRACDTFLNRPQSLGLGHSLKAHDAALLLKRLRSGAGQVHDGNPGFVVLSWKKCRI